MIFFFLEQENVFFGVLGEPALWQMKLILHDSGGEQLSWISKDPLSKVQWLKPTRETETCPERL